jgi:hypothetical protein
MPLGGNGGERGTGFQYLLPKKEGYLLPKKEGDPELPRYRT